MHLCKLSSSVLSEVVTFEVQNDLADYTLYKLSLNFLQLLLHYYYTFPKDYGLHVRCLATFGFQITFGQCLFHFVCSSCGEQSMNR